MKPTTCTKGNRSWKRKVGPLRHFWQRVSISGGPQACWRWNGSSYPGGYGRYRRNGRVVRASHVAWELSNHAGILPGYCVLHRCDNPCCVNPRHLFLGTIKDNHDDMDAKGRRFIASGGKHGMATLTDEQVIEMRRRYAAGGIQQRALADEYGVTSGAVANIVNGKSWTHLPMPEALIGREKQAHRRKLSPDQVHQVRAALMEGQKRKDVAERFGVAYTTICAIASGHNWSRV